MNQVGELVLALGCHGQGGRVERGEKGLLGVGLIRFADRSAGRNKDRKN